MERLRNLRIVVWLVALILALQFVMLIVMLRPDSFFLWATLGLFALMFVYLVRICLVLVKELEKKEKEDNKK